MNPYDTAYYHRDTILYLIFYEVREIHTNNTYPLCCLTINTTVHLQIPNCADDRRFKDGIIKSLLEKKNILSSHSAAKFYHPIHLI